MLVIEKSFAVVGKNAWTTCMIFLFKLCKDEFNWGNLGLTVNNFSLIQQNSTTKLGKPLKESKPSIPSIIFKCILDLASIFDKMFTLHCERLSMQLILRS